MKRNNYQISLRLLALVKPLVPVMIIAIVMGVIGFLCAIFITVFGGLAITNLLGFSTLSISTIFISLGFFAVLRGVLRYAEQASNHYIAFKLLAIIRDKIFGVLRTLAPAKLEGRDKGDLISLITTDIELIEVFYAHTISPVAIAIITSIIMVVFIGQYHIVLAMIAIFGYFTVGIIIPVVTSKKITSLGHQYRQGSGELSSFILESLRGLGQTIQYNNGHQRLRAIQNKTISLSEQQEHLKKAEGINAAITNTTILLFSCIMLFVSTMLFQEETINFTGVLISTIAMMSSFGPVVALSSLANNLAHTFAAANRVLDILDETPQTSDITNQPEVDFNSISCSEVDFSYTNEPLLTDINLDIKKDQIFGITGKSGSGKSTLLKLLMRFWSIDKGNIRIGDTNIENINTTNLRDMQSLVTQETVLFKDTIANNIKVAKLDATTDEVIEACQKAAIHDFIISLPKGYDSDVGELGDTLSGGQKQRMGVARAFLHDAPFILLDEATSNLDSLSEGIILKSLIESSQQKTVLLVSHRASTMAIADKVYNFESKRDS